MERTAAALFHDFIETLSREIGAMLPSFSGNHDEDDTLVSWKGFPRRQPFYVKTLKFWTELSPGISLSLLKEVEAWATPPFLGMSTSKFSLNQEVVFTYLRLLETLWALVSADLVFHLLHSCDLSSSEEASARWQNLLIAAKLACALPSREEENRPWYPVFAQISILARVQWSAVFGLLSAAGGSHEGDRFRVSEKEAGSGMDFFHFFSTALFPSMNASEYTLVEAYTTALLCGSLRLPVHSDSRMSMRVVILLSKILSSQPHPGENGVSAVLLKTLDMLMLQFDFPRLLKLSSTQRIPRTSSAQWELFFEETVVQRVLKPAETLAKFERFKPAALHLMCTLFYLSPDAYRKQHFAKFIQHRVFRHLNEPKKLRHSIQIVLHAVRLACGKRKEKPGWNAFDRLRVGDLGLEIGNDAAEFLDLCFAEVFERSKSRVMNSVPVLGSMTTFLRPFRSAQWGDETAQEFRPLEDLRTPVLSLLLEMARNSPNLLTQRILPSLLQLEDVYKATSVNIRKALLGLELVNQVLSACRADSNTLKRVEELCSSCEDVLNSLGSSQWPLIPTRVHVRRCSADGNDLTGFALNREFCWAEEDTFKYPEGSFETFHYRTAEAFHTVAIETPFAWALSEANTTEACGECWARRATLTKVLTFLMNTGSSRNIERSAYEVLSRCKQHGLKPDRVFHALSVAYEALPALAMLEMTTKVSSVAQRLIALLTHVDWGIATSASFALQRMILCAEDELQRALVISALVDYVEKRVFGNIEAPLVLHVCGLQTLLQQLLLLLEVWHAQRKLAPLPSDGTEHIVREEWNLRIPAIAMALHVYPIEAFRVAGQGIVRLLTAIVRSLPFAVEWALDVIVERNSAALGEHANGGTQAREHLDDQRKRNDNGAVCREGYNWTSMPLYHAGELIGVLRNLKSKNRFVTEMVEKIVRKWKYKLDQMIRRGLGEEPPCEEEADLLLRLHWRVLVIVICLCEDSLDEALLFECWDLSVDCRQQLVSAESPSSEEFIFRLMRGLETFVGEAATSDNVHVYIGLLLEWHSAQEIQASASTSTDDAGHRFLAKILKRGGHKAVAAAAESVELEEKRFNVCIEAMVVLRNTVERLDIHVPTKHVTHMMKSIQKMVAQMNVDTLQAAGATLAQVFADLLVAVGSWLFRHVTAKSQGETVIELYQQADGLWKRAERRKAWRLLQRLSGFSDIPVGFQMSDGEEGDLPFRGSMKKLRISAAEYERLQRSIAQAASALLTLGPVSLGNVPAPPESWHWAWFYSEWEATAKGEVLGFVDKRTYESEVGQCVKEGPQLTGLFSSYLLAHWRMGDKETWITFQAYLEEYYKNEEACRVEEAFAVFSAIASSLCVSVQGDNTKDRFSSGSHAAITGKCVFLGLVQVRASTSLRVRQQALLMLQRIIGEAAALGGYAEDLDDVWLVRQNAERISVKVYECCSSDVRRSVFDELCRRLPQLCVAGRALAAVDAVLPLLQFHSLPCRPSPSAPMSFNEGEDPEISLLPLPALWSSFHRCAAKIEPSAMAKLAVHLFVHMASRREAVGVVLGFLAEQQAEGSEDAYRFTLAADMLVKCSVHLLNKFPEEVVDTLVPLLEIPRQGAEDGEWQSCALSRKRVSRVHSGPVPGESAFIEALSCCLKRDPQRVVTAIPTLTAYCMCYSNLAGNPTASTVDETVALHVHMMQVNKTLETKEDPDKPLTMPVVDAFARLCTLVDSEEKLPQSLCRGLLTRLVLAQDDEMRCRALIALVELRKVFRCASDSNEDWVRVEVLCLILVLERAWLNRNEELLHACLCFLSDLHELGQQFGRSASDMAAAVDCVVALLDSGNTEWKLPDAASHLLVHFYVDAVLDEGFRDYVPPVSTVKRLVHAQILELQSIGDGETLQLTQKMLQVGRLHEDYEGYGVMIVYIAALSCGEHFHVLKKAVGSLGTQCFGLEEEVEPIIVVVERLMERYGSTVLKEVLNVSCACGIPDISSAWMESVFQIAIAVVQLESSPGLLPVFQFSLKLQAQQDLARYDLDWIHTRETSKQFNDIYAENGELDTHAAAEAEEYDVAKIIQERVESERETLRRTFGYAEEEQKDMDESLEGGIENSMNEVFITSRKKVKKQRDTDITNEKAQQESKPREMFSGASTFEQVRLHAASGPVEFSSPEVSLTHKAIPTPFDLCVADCVNVLEENEIIKLLRHEVISDALMSFMRAHKLNTGWLEFARECLLFSNSPTPDRAADIAQRFIKLDALDTLPIDRKLRSKILEAKNINRTLFDDVLVKSIDYIKEHAYSDFLRSRFFTNLVSS